MNNSPKKHFYIAFATFRDRNRKDDFFQNSNSEFSLTSTKITKTVLKNISDSIQVKTQSENPDLDIYDFRLNSISYLGEMTDEEFSS